MSQIPQEILDSIVAFVATDLDTLKACALASSAFLHSTRSYLFREVKLDGPARMQEIQASTGRGVGALVKALLGTSQAQSDIPRNRCHQLSQTLCISPHLMSYVRKLHINTQHLSLVYPIEPTLACVLNSFSLLEAIEICFLQSWESIRLDIRRALNDIFRSPTMKEIAFQNGWVYLDVLEIGPSVQSLVFDRATISGTEESSTSKDDVIELTSLYFTEDSPPIFGSLPSLAMYITSPSPRFDITNLRTLTLSWGSASDIELVDVIGRCGSSLHELTLLDEGTALKSLDLSNCSGLRILRMKSVLKEHYRLPPWWANTLSTACHTLQELNIRIIPREPPNPLEFDDWNHMNKSLALQHGCRVSICIPTHHSKFLAPIEANTSTKYSPLRQCVVDCLCQGTGHSVSTQIIQS